jgi:hypothetical protein
LNTIGGRNHACKLKEVEATEKGKEDEEKSREPSVQKKTQNSDGDSE